MGTILDLRGIVANEIIKARDSMLFSFSGFEVRATNDPYMKIKDLPELGLVYVIGLIGDDAIETRESESMLVAREQPIQIAYQRLLQFNSPGANDALVDQLTNFVEDLIRVVRRATITSDDPMAKNFSFLRSEALKDANGTPYNFTRLREQNVFEAYFSTIYQTYLR